MSEKIRDEVAEAATIAAVAGEAFSPQYMAFMVLGRSVAAAAPELYNDVLLLLQKDQPDPQAVAVFANKVSSFELRVPSQDPKPET